MQTGKPAGLLLLMTSVLIGSCQTATLNAGESEEEVSARTTDIDVQRSKRGESGVALNERGEKLLAAYTEMLSALKAEIVAAAPTIDEQKKTAFLAAHAAVEAVPAQPNPGKSKNAPPRYAESNPAYKEAQSKATDAARMILADVDAFLGSDQLHAQLVKCALLAHATPRGLAEFAQQGEEQQALVDDLLKDAPLMRQVMEMGGAYEGKYGRAMQSYRAILKASTHARDGFFQRFALASSLEHPDGSIEKEGLTAAEVNVEIYLDYEKAYLEGKLDKAFDSYSDFDYRFIMHHHSVEDLEWMRTMMRNYRPDHITMDDYKWRYCRIVRTDVPYTGGLSGRRPLRPDLNLTRFQDFFLEGGICGPRCFTGKLATAAFGIPTRGARQTGHAAMCHWTPEGWTTVFGGPWAFNSWRGRCGLDFFLESQARRNPQEYLKVLRSQFLGDAFDEPKVSTTSYGVGGGPWNALAFYKKLLIVEEAKIVALGPTGEELGESNVEAKAEGVPQVELTEADKTIVVDKDGVITIPVAACANPVSTDKIRFMKTIDGDGVQAHYSLGGALPEILTYNVEVPKAGNYQLTAHVVTVTVDRTFILRLNRRQMVTIPLPYTKGMWKDTEPVTIPLKEGRNSLMFTATAPNKGVTIRHFNLKPAGE